MSKKILECQYCKSIITEKDTTCPKCGANCSDVIKEYKEEIEKEQEQKRKEISDSINKSFNNFSKIPLLIFGIAFVIIFFIICTTIIRFNSNNKKKEPITGKVNETIKSDTYKLKIDGYEAFEYHDDFFKDCNTKQDYQKVAFHFIIENTTDETISTNNIVRNIVLKAEDEQLNRAEVKTDTNFCKVVQGKEEYNSLPSTTILSHDKVSGYVGFQVPINKEKLKFIIEENLIVEMDNPFFEKK